MGRVAQPTMDVLVQRRLATLTGVLLVIACIAVARAGAHGSARAGMIAYERSYEEIYVMNADGTGQRRLTPRSWSSFGPVWSPDGTKIVFVRTGPSTDEYDPKDELYLVSADGSSLRRLTRNARHDQYPTWAPDVRRIAFASTGVGIHVVNVKGGTLRRLSRGAYDDQPAWSPNWTAIAFTSSDYPDQPDIWVMDADGRNRRRLTQAGTAADGDNGGPVWWPDGKSIAFARTPSFQDPGPSGSAVYVVNADGSGLRRLTDIRDAEFPVWSPDGTRIAFLSWQRNDYDLYVMRADGSGLRRLAPTAGIPSWSPDGKKIVFEKRDDIYVMNALGGAQKRLTRSPEVDSGPVWQPSR